MNLSCLFSLFDVSGSSNKTNQIDQTNQINQMNLTDRFILHPAERTYSGLSGIAVSPHSWGGASVEIARRREVLYRKGGNAQYLRITNYGCVERLVEMRVSLN